MSKMIYQILNTEYLVTFCHVRPNHETFAFSIVINICKPNSSSHKVSMIDSYPEMGVIVIGNYDCS